MKKALNLLFLLLCLKLPVSASLFQDGDLIRLTRKEILLRDSKQFRVGLKDELYKVAMYDESKRKIFVYFTTEEGGQLLLNLPEAAVFHENENFAYIIEKAFLSLKSGELSASKANFQNMTSCDEVSRIARQMINVIDNVYSAITDIASFKQQRIKIEKSIVDLKSNIAKRRPSVLRNDSSEILLRNQQDSNQIQLLENGSLKAQADLLSVNDAIRNRVVLSLEALLKENLFFEANCLFNFTQGISNHFYPTFRQSLLTIIGDPAVLNARSLSSIAAFKKVSELTLGVRHENVIEIADAADKNGFSSLMLKQLARKSHSEIARKFEAEGDFNRARSHFHSAGLVISERRIAAQLNQPPTLTMPALSNQASATSNPVRSLSEAIPPAAPQGSGAIVADQPKNQSSHQKSNKALPGTSEIKHSYYDGLDYFDLTEFLYKFEPRGPKIHGFQIGMSFAAFQKNLDNVYASQLRYGYVKYIGEMVSIGDFFQNRNLCVCPMGFTTNEENNTDYGLPLWSSDDKSIGSPSVTFIAAGQEKTIIYFSLEKPLIDKLFKASSLPFDEFCKRFMNGYSIPKIQRTSIDPNSFAVYTSPSGWRLVLNGYRDRVVQIQMLLTPAEEELGFGK
jgi:hypothetical protein